MVEVTSVASKNIHFVCFGYLHEADGTLELRSPSTHSSRFDLEVGQPRKDVDRDQLLLLFSVDSAQVECKQAAEQAEVDAKPNVAHC